MPEHRIDPEIAAYYELGLEHERLTRHGQIERLRTRVLLERLLPPAPAVVLDVGGAAGVHALPLAADGYEVRLLDPVARHVEQARAASAAQPQAPLAEAVAGDARALPWADASADALLLLGPLYHLDAAGRLAALAEARRVLKPGAPLLAAAVSRFASTFDGVRARALADAGFAAGRGRRAPQPGRPAGVVHLRPLPPPRRAVGGAGGRRLRGRGRPRGRGAGVVPGAARGGVVAGDGRPPRRAAGGDRAGRAGAERARRQRPSDRGRAAAVAAGRPPRRLRLSGSGAARGRSRSPRSLCRRRA